MDTRTAAKLRRQLGYFSLPEVCEMCQTEVRSFREWTDSGLLPKPTVRIGGRRAYYPAAVMEQIKERIEKGIE
jgi:DNA-binding transcriptional MerR regulator